MTNLNEPLFQNRGSFYFIVETLDQLILKVFSKLGMNDKLHLTI